MSRPRPTASPRVLGAAALALPLLAAPLAARAQGGTTGTRIVLDSVDLTGVTTLGELLQARAPGLLVQTSGGLAGSATVLSSRGRRSGGVTTDDPLLVVDGLRVVGGRAPSLVDSAFATSRYDDLPVEQLAMVDVLPGPAAAARFGPGASAGAIVVTTRRAAPAAARGGRTERRLYADGGAGTAGGDRPTYYRGMGVFTNGAQGPGCTIDMQSSAACRFTGTEAVRPYDAAGWTTGLRGRAGARLAGGPDRARFAVGLDGARLGGPVQGSRTATGTLRASADLEPFRGLRVALGTGLLTGTTDAPLGGLEPRLDLGVNRNPAFLATPLPTRADAALRTRRLDASGSAEWVARPWLTARVAVSTSVAHQRERSRAERPGDGLSGTAIFFQDGEGDARTRVTVAEVGAAAGYRVGGAALTTALTAQRVDDRVNAYARQEQGSVAPGEQPFSSWSAFWARGNADVRGLVLAQRAEAGRLRAGGTLRTDRVGEDRARATTGAADAAYRVWTGRGVARSVDVRAAVGTAVGRSLARFPQYGAGAFDDGSRYPIGDAPSPSAGPARPTPLPRFERTRETEVGLDARFGSAVAAAVTAYDQRTRDVLLPAIPVYQGYFPVGYTFAPATLANRGVEASVRARLVEQPGAGLTLGLHAWAARNRVRDLGVQPLLMGGVGGATQTVRDGAPLGAFVGLPGAPRARDYDGNGRVTSAEAARAATDALRASDFTPVRPVVGSPVPTRTVAADLRGRAGARLTYAALVEYQGGRSALGDGALLFGAARGSVDPAAPVAEQARAASRPAVGFSGLGEALLEGADFVRLREVSASWRLGGRPGGRGTVVTLAARNLLTLTSYTGLDPEAGADGALGAGLAGVYAVPLARTVALRLSADW